MNEYRVNSLLVLRNRKIEYNYLMGCYTVEYSIKSSIIILILIKKMFDNKFIQAWKCFYGGQFIDLILFED